jgi:drug/metabolite transporter (DMT)-like permease
MLTQWLLVGAIVIATAGGDLLQASHMKRHHQTDVGVAAASFIRQPLMMLSLVCMAISFGSFLLLLRIADLSFAVPATAISFVVETALARWYLGEQVCGRRWAASLLIACGVALLAL